MDKKVRVVVLGSFLYECVTYGMTLPRKGETIVGYDNAFTFGGKGSNQAVQAARLGADVSFIGRVGKDAIGDTLVKGLVAEGIDSTYVTVDEFSSSGTCCIHVDECGDNAIMVAPNANLKITKSNIDAAMEKIASCDIFLLQLETNVDVVEYAIEQAHKHKVKIVLNPAPAVKINSNIFQYVDYFTPNETETEFFTGILPNISNKNTCVEAADKLLSLGVKNVIMTLGANGVFYATKTHKKWFPEFSIKAIEVTAAGDAFNAGFCVKLAEGASLDDAIIFGNAAGAMAASQKGAQASLASREKIEGFLLRNEYCMYNVKKYI